MRLCRFGLVVVLNCFVVESILATDDVAIPSLDFSYGDIKSWADQLQTMLSSQISTNYVVTLNCELPEIIVPDRVTNVVDRSMYDEALTSFKSEVVIKRKLRDSFTQTKFPLRYVTLCSTLDFIDNAFCSQSKITGNVITIQMFPSRLQFELYKSNDAKKTGLIPFESADSFERVKTAFSGEWYIVLAPPELHHEFHRLVKEISSIPD